MENKYWINYEEYKKLNEYTKYLESKWWAWSFYGIHSGQYPEFEEFQNCNKSRGIPLKDSSEVLERNGYSTLLGIKERGDLLQDSLVYIPSGTAKGIDVIRPTGLEGRPTKDWSSFCSTIKS